VGKRYNEGKLNKRMRNQRGGMKRNSRTQKERVGKTPRFQNGKFLTDVRFRGGNASKGTAEQTSHCAFSQETGDLDAEGGGKPSSKQEGATQNSWPSSSWGMRPDGTSFQKNDVGRSGEARLQPLTLTK